MEELQLRVIALENSHSTLNKIAAQQLVHNREVDEHLTILLGVVKSQGADISAIQADISSLKGDVASLEGDVASLKGDVATMQVDIVAMKEALSRIETRMDERFDAIMALLQSRRE